MAEKETQYTYLSLLQNAYAQRRQKNPQYSLRAFSRDLGVSPAVLSQVLSYKRTLSPKNIRAVATRLGLGPIAIEQMLNERKKGKNAYKPTERELLEDDVFRLMSDWYYFAILSLSRLPKCPSEPNAVAERLGISRTEAQAALKRLEKLKLIEKRGRYLVRTSNPITTTDNVPSAALKNFHKQHLGIAAKCVDEVSLDLRSISSITMAIDPSKIKQTQKMISDFRNKMASLLESGKAEEVYTLAVHLYPLTKQEKSK